MVNQKTYESLYNYYFDEEIEHDDESEEELYHHGVLGQSWGKKHGPPYPLDGVDKKIARAEAKKKKERERKLKKMQRAAKKARKAKQREEKKQEDILKKKQKLMKKGDMQAIKKNSHLFTNEELAYIMDRENLKKGFKDKKERTDDEKMELFMKRFGQIANIASSAEAVFKMAKAGTDVYKSLKETKVKELEAEDKRMSAIKSEFEMRFQGDARSSAEAKQFIDDRVNDRDYKTPKETKIEKKERKMVEDARSRQVDQYYKDMEAADKAEKQAKKAEKQKRKDEKIAKREEKKERKKNEEDTNVKREEERDINARKVFKATSSKNISQIVKSREVQSGIEYVKSRYQESDRLRALDAYGGTKLRSRYEIVKDESGKESKYDRFSNLKTGNNSWKPKESKRERDEINNVKWAAYRLEQVIMNSNKNSYKDDVEKLLESTTFTSLSDDRQKEAIDMAKQSLKTLGFK